ncbi:type I-E CRISPR-associated protein Cse1/CasA [Telmatospirillum sp.]|uniref:type I-E CRISPR-associated protein Cse1/CasA n=1 Tax=Telmatospirillum sp. TaxID=2079197 RepID=UPI00283F940F|nr:type I-E CRISPR-associated protein Cse1/CasA [Telmatospirillum sp.]MDR3439162.1 type I-E CRISPR-associated protein Cse1/CasA [Telmatospirillum sp.]
MAFNLLTAPWLEVRRASGVRHSVRPCDITDRFDDDPILALDFPRPDWNGALTEFLIGLCALAMAPEDADDWAERFAAPPTPDVLAKALASFVGAFDFDGDGSRAFQDFDPLAHLEVKPLNGLLIDAPGENALRNNSDLFIKRGGAAALCLPYAAAALITLQTYAPAGGAGHRTSLRGGGPLTTLMAPRRAAAKAATLWDRVWTNVPDQDEDARRVKPDAAFPWLAATRTSAKGEMITTQAGSHPALAFFACPRRIRLVFADDVACGLGGATGPGAIGLRTQNYGANYLLWRHPLSPYYRQDEKSDPLPRHPGSGQANYGDWLAWWGFNGFPAIPVSLWGNRRSKIASLIDTTDGIDVFGFDMDNMKARQWLAASVPWIPTRADAGPALQDAVTRTIAAADAAARAVALAAKIALYGERRETGYQLPKNRKLDAIREPGDRLWRETEADFRRHLGALRDCLKDGEADTQDLAATWLLLLRSHALDIFDETVDLDGLTDKDPRRLLWARDRLIFEFSRHAKAGVRKALGLAVAATVQQRKAP